MNDGVDHSGLFALARQRRDVGRLELETAG